MKKLLVLLMVLAIASIANATISLSQVGTATLENGWTQRVDIVAADETGASSWMLAVVGVGMDAGTMLYTGNKAAITTVEDGDAIAVLNGSIATYIETHTDFLGGELDDADFLEFQYTDPVVIPNGICASYIVTGYSEIYLIDSNFEPVVDAVIVIPEPITVALLGLGGLFLRRRK